MVEFTLVAPVITLIGLLVLQWALTFHARHQLQHAAFMAARAGATAQGRPEAIEAAFVSALGPLYGGGRNLVEVQASEARARADLTGRMRVEILNPTRESFDDWADPMLQRRLRAPARVIPNDGLTVRSAAAARQVGPQSGQTLADANQLHLRISAGLALQVPLASNLIRALLRATDRGADPAASAWIAEGRLPSHVEVMVQMQSPALETAAIRPLASRTERRTAAPGEPAAFDPDSGACGTVGCRRNATVGAGVRTDPDRTRDRSPAQALPLPAAEPRLLTSPPGAVAGRASPSLGLSIPDPDEPAPTCLPDATGSAACPFCPT